MKKEHWKSIKADFLKIIPESFQIDVEDLDNESDYYHPVILVEENIIIRGQCDINTEYVYGLDIKFNEFNGHTYSISINDYKELVFLLSDWDRLKVRIIESMDKCKLIYQMEEELKKVRDNLMSCAILEISDREKMLNAKDSLYKVTEFIENNRL